jgi:hypothetical protein
MDPEVDALPSGAIGEVAHGRTKDVALSDVDVDWRQPMQVGVDGADQRVRGSA